MDGFKGHAVDVNMGQMAGQPLILINRIKAMSKIMLTNGLMECARSLVALCLHGLKREGRSDGHILG
ncbi:hypothetical protein XF14_13250 [Burkholderia gladioli]|nr:hypothetical protein XF14_13250 [Burkholderia gladioli]